MSAAHRRDLARQAVARSECGQRLACRFFGFNRSTYRYRARAPRLPWQQAEQAVVDLSQEHPELGSDKIGNGPEFVARRLGNWLGEREIKTLYIEPGSPWQNGYVESFHDKFRRECLARELFYTPSESRVVIADWRWKYNRVRPH